MSPAGFAGWRRLPLLWGLGLSLALAACGGGDGRSTASASGAVPTMRALAVTPASVMINEVVAGSWLGARDEDGDAEDWVELYNPGDSPMDLTGFGLSHRANSPFRWAFPSGASVPAKGHLRVWLSKKNRTANGAPLHTNFNLDSGADGVFLSASNASASGVLVDSAQPPLLAPDQSWCRMPSGSLLAPFQACVTPTPGQANTGTSHATVLAAPRLSVAGGFYSAAQTVSATGPAGATLRYTLDGSEPTAASPVLPARLAVATSSALRVAAFASGAAPSPSVTATFVIDAGLATRYQSLKAMMVTIAPDDLAAFLDNDKKRDFKANFEYVTGGRTVVFNMPAEGQAGGNVGSASSPQRTMNVSGRDAFGVKDFPAVFWPDRPGITSHRKFRLRNGSSDWGAAHLRDQLAQRMAGDAPNLYAASATVAMFINGRYYAMMDLREREDENLPANNLKIEKDYVDYLTDPLLLLEEIKNGGTAARNAYRAMHDQVTGADQAQAANYAATQRLLSPESLAYDWALHMFLGNTDWPMRNVHVWRSPEIDGRWTWRPHDFDLAMDSYREPARNMNDAFAAEGAELVNALLRNSSFRTLYINTVADQMNTLTPTGMEAVLDVMAADMRPYVADYYALNNLGGAERWEAAMDALRFWMGQREPAYDQHTRAWFGLGQRQPISVAVNDPRMGSVQVNGVQTGAYMSTAYPRWSGMYYPGVPITLTARPRPGYSFVGWQGASTSSARQITHSLQAPASSLPADNFSVRWRGSIEPPVSGSAILQMAVDDGVRLWLDGVLVIDSWTAKSTVVSRGATVNLVAGRRHDLRIEYFDAGGEATAQLGWRLANSSRVVAVPRQRLYPVGAAASPTATGTGLTAQYFANPNLAGTPAFEQVEGVNFNWGTGAPWALAAPVTWTAVFAAAGGAQAPVMAAVPAQSGSTGNTVRVALQASDAVDAALSFSAQSLPAGLAISPRTGVIYGQFTRPGTWTSTITASNGAASASTTISWTVLDRPGTGLRGSSPGWAGNTAPVNQPPAVAITSPANGTRYTTAQSISVSASASDADGSIAKVDFYYGGNTLIATATQAPYSFTRSGVAADTYVVTAVATDNSGATSTSAPVTLTVSAAGAGGQAGPGSGSGLRGSYFNASTPGGAVQATRVEAINYIWGTAAPMAGVNADNFSVRWQGLIEAPASGAVQLRTLSDDGVRVWVNGALVIDNWTPHSATTDTSAALSAVAGQRYSIVVEYQELTGDAQIQLFWRLPGESGFSLVPASRLYVP